MALLTSISNSSATVLLLVESMIVYLLYRFVYNIFFHPIAHIPGPMSAKVFPLWTMRVLWKANLCPALAKLHERYGNVVRTGPDELSFTSVEAFNTIYRVPHTKSRQGHYFSKDGTLQDAIANLIFRASTIGTEGDRLKHRQLRNRMAPAFSAEAALLQQATHGEHLERMFVDIDDEVALEKAIDLRPHFSKMLWNMVSDLSFGEPLVADKRDTFISMENTYRSMFPWLELVNSLFPWLEKAVFHASKLVPAATARAFLPTGQLRQRMQRHDKRYDFLTAIMGEYKRTKDYAELDWDSLYSNASFFVVSGYFTNEIAHSALLYHLLRNPQSMQRLKAELRTAFSSLNQIDASAIKTLPFLNACISESLRLLPPLAGKFMSRRSPGAFIDGIWVPFGIQVFVDGYVVQRSPNNFVDPDDFRPDRFLCRDKGSRYEHDVHEAYKPFSAGPRTCIGRELALQSLQLTTAKLIWAYDIEFEEGKAYHWEADCKSSALWAEYRLPVRIFPAAPKSIVDDTPY